MIWVLLIKTLLVLTTIHSLFDVVRRKGIVPGRGRRRMWR